MACALRCLEIGSGNRSLVEVNPPRFREITTHKVILDTDIGTDVDDLFTLTFLLGSPEVDLLGATAGYGDTALRGKLAHHALSLAGREEVSVAVGELPTLRGQREVYWAGHEGKNARVEELPVVAGHDAADFILETLRRYPSEVTLLAVAPLTNVAQAIERDQETMGKFKHIVMMGGVFGFDDANGFPAAKHNFRCDLKQRRSFLAVTCLSPCFRSI